MDLCRLPAPGQLERGAHLLSPISPITIARSAPITGMVLSYDGINQYALQPSMVLPPFTTVSIEAWVNIDGIPGTQWTHAGALWANNDNSFSLIFELAPLPPPPAPQIQKAQLAIAKGGTPVKFSYLFSPGQWYYIVVTVNTTTGTATLYVNAALTEPSVTGIAAGPVTLGPAWIGGAQQSLQAFYQGSIGTIRIWNGTLDQAYIERLMYLTLSGTVVAKNNTGQTIATLVANWRCNEGYGDFAFDYSGPSWDLSLGGGDPAKRPTWHISTILKPPDFVDALPVSALGAPDSMVAGRSVADQRFITRVIPPPPFRIDPNDVADSGKKKEAVEG